MANTHYYFLFPAYNTNEQKWCIMAAQPLGNVFIEGGFSSQEQAVLKIEKMQYGDYNTCIEGHGGVM